jgi:hypothetical protein
MHDETAFFIHIPKTAGTTLHRIIDRQYPRRARHFVYHHHQGVQELKEMSHAQRTELRMVRGHIPYGLHEFLPRPVKYFTILRDPVERVISYYYYVQREPEHYRYDYANAPGMTIKRYLEEHTSLQTDNMQTRLVSGIWTDVGYGECTPAMLEQAKENLAERIAVVGLTEQFDETLLLLQRAFGWRSVYYHWHNVTQGRPRRASLSPDALDVIAAHNQLDVELYSFGRKLFEKQVRDQGPSFAQDVERFRAGNRRVQPLLRAYWTARQYSVRVWLRGLWESALARPRSDRGTES